MTRLPAHVLCTLLFFGVGCTKGEGTPPPAATAGATAGATVTPTSLTVGSATAAVKAARSARSAKASAEPMLPKARREAYANALTAGRKFAVHKKWEDAVAEFEKALAAKPNDARAMAELGYSAALAGDTAKAASWNVKTLATATDPVVLAQVHYNQGQLDEKNGNKDLARAHYEKSLLLRPNATVEKALSALGAASARRCESRSFPSIDALCTCITTSSEKRAELNTADEYKRNLTCTETKVAIRTGDAASRVHALRWGASEDSGEHPALLVVEDTGLLRIGGPLGADFDPGAFGIHNETEVVSIETKKIGARLVAYVTWKQDNIDFNMGGLQAEEYHAKNVTVCIIGEKGGPKCPVTVAVDEKVALVYPLDPDSPQMEADLADLKKEAPPKEDVYNASFTLDDDGTFKVQETRGKRKELAAYTAGIKLW